MKQNSDKSNFIQPTCCTAGLIALSLKSASSLNRSHFWGSRYRKWMNECTHLNVEAQIVLLRQARGYGGLNAQSIKQCSFVAYQGRAETFWQIFERRVPHKIGSRSESTTRIIHTLGAPHFKAHCRFLRKLKDFKCALWSEKYGKWHRKRQRES